MDRRKFIRISGLSTFIVSPAIYNIYGGKDLKAKDINSYLRSLIEVKEPSVDRIIVGDPETRVEKIGTAWQPYWDTLKKARNEGVNVMIVHEPTFYTHWDLDAEKWDYLDAPEPARGNYLKLRDKKRSWIEENDMVVIRCHDVLDKLPVWGIPFALGRALGLNNEDIIRSQTYYNVYKINARPAGQVAKDIALKLRALNQPGVAFYGDENFMVESIGLGTGTICDPLRFAELKPDLFIVIDDSINTWTQTTFSRDSRKPLVVINHGTSEEPGTRALNDHLKKTYPGYDVLHFDQGCGFKFIS